MNNLLAHKGYFGTVEYSDEDNLLHGKVVGIRSLILYHGKNIDELKQTFIEMIDEYLEDCKADGREPNKTSKEILQEELTERFQKSMKNYVAI